VEPSFSELLGSDLINTYGGN
jgi:hypothetical protein